jgi:hypothetical protein
MPFELDFLNDLERDLLAPKPNKSRPVDRGRRRTQRRRLELLGGALVAAIALVLIGLGAHPWRSGSSTGVSNASAAIEQRLRGLQVVHTKSGDVLDTTDAVILGSAVTSQGTLFLVSGFHLVSGIAEPCEGVLAPAALDDSFSQLPDSNLFFGQYSCGSGRGWGSGGVSLGDVAVGLYGSEPAGVTSVSLVGPSGSVDLPLHHGVYGTVVPFTDAPPTKLVSYDAAGNVVATHPLLPQDFAKDYTPPDSASLHHTLIAETLPDGTPITVERTETDRFGAYAWFLTLAGQPIKGQEWEDDGPIDDASVPKKPDFWVDDVLPEGDARVVLVQSRFGAAVTATLSDGTAIPLQFQTVSSTYSLALAVIPPNDAAGTLTVSGTAPGGSALGSDTIDLPTSAVTMRHETN